jgi:hypothetical protein
MHHRSDRWRRSFRAPSLLVTAAIVLAAHDAPVLGATEPDDAARQFEAEAARLEAANDATQEAWRTQDGLVQDLLADAADLERAYGDPDATVAELRALEDRYEAALAAAYRQAKTTIANRRRVYDQMDKLAALGRRIESERRAVLDAPMPGGLWRFEIPGANLVGIMKLEMNGGSVSGTYRLSNGGRGTVSGSYGGGQLELTRFDSGGSGRDAVLRAAVDEQAGTLDGEWVRFELGAGEPGSGRWHAERVSDESALEELEQ